MINLTIDGQPLTVPKGTTVYTAAKQMGIEIPIFCYHDRMPPFGACRMCLVQVEKMPKLQTSCTLEVSEGMVVNTVSDAAIEGRKGILEFLLINHPLDCPICDKGGECPLQDQTLSDGPGKSRFYEEKRRFKKPIPLGPVLMLDRERCIICARCTRFGDIVAGDHALEFIDRGFRTEVGTIDDKVSDSKFIGNTIMICPVGALTSQVYRFRARPWDNDTVDSSCTLCPVGCSLKLDSRDGEIMRTRFCENRDVNDVWLCDKGWFGYEFASSPDRLQTPLLRHNGDLFPASWEEALSYVAEKIAKAKPNGRIAALGGIPLTTEENYLFQKLMREGVGVNHIDYRVGMPILSLEEEGIAAGMEMSIGECEDLNYVLLLGLDLTEEFPVIWLRLKQAINKGAKVIFIGHYAPEIAPYMHEVHLHAPGQGEKILTEQLAKQTSQSAQGQKTAAFIGQQYLASPDRKLILASLLSAKGQNESLKINLLEGKGNSFGARLAGMHPELAPLNERLSTPGLNAQQWLETTAKEGWDLLYVAGADPATKFPTALWEQARSKLGILIVQDLFLTKTAMQADVVLPAFCYIEKSGHFVNLEGRLQKMQVGKMLPEGLYSDGEIFTLLAEKMGYSLQLGTDFIEALNSNKVAFAKRPEKLEFHVHATDLKADQGDLLATFAPSLFDSGVRMKHNQRLSMLIKPPKVRIHPNEGKKRNLTDGQIVRVHANGNSVTSKLKFDSRIAGGTLMLPLGFEQIAVCDLSPNLWNGIAVTLEA